MLLKPAAGSAGERLHSVDSKNLQGQQTQTAQQHNEREKKLLSELQNLLETVSKVQRTSPAVDAQLKRLFEALIWVNPVAAAELIGNNESRRRFDLLQTLPNDWPESRPLLYRSVLQNLGNAYPEEMLAHVMTMPPSEF